jgi:GNAT superfamily N-acetyltransferase
MVLHPDQRPVLFLNEIAVDDAAQRRGTGTLLMEAAIDLARSRGWASTWVLAENDDEAAKTFYRSLSPATSQPSVMFEWEE